MSLQWISFPCTLSNWLHDFSVFILGYVCWCNGCPEWGVCGLEVVACIYTDLITNMYQQLETENFLSNNKCSNNSLHSVSAGRSWNLWMPPVLCTQTFRCVGLFLSDSTIRAWKLLCGICSSSGEAYLALWNRRILDISPACFRSFADSRYTITW